MSLEVMQKISNGVVSKETKILRKVGENCHIISSERGKATVQEQVNILTRTGLHLSRNAKWQVTWNTETQMAHCTCNELTYGGIPCQHIVCAALGNNFKIPLSCFNPRFFASQEEVSARLLSPIFLPTMSEGDPPELPSPSEDHSEEHTQPHEEATAPTVIADSAKSIADVLHITDAWHAGKHNDEQSMLILGKTRALEACVLRVVDLTGTSDKMARLIDSWQRTISEELLEIQRNNPRVFELEHARSHSNRITWRNFQQEVDQARDNALNEIVRTEEESIGNNEGNGNSSKEDERRETVHEG